MNRIKKIATFILLLCCFVFLVGLVIKILPLTIIKLVNPKKSGYYMTYGKAFRDIFDIMLFSVITIPTASLVVYLYKSHKFIIDRMINIVVILLLSGIPIAASSGYESVKDFEQNKFVTELISYWNSNESYNTIEADNFMLNGESVAILGNIIIDMGKAKNDKSYPSIYDEEYSLIHLDSISKDLDNTEVTKEFSNYWKTSYNTVFNIAKIVILIIGGIVFILILWLCIKSEESQGYPIHKYIDKQLQINS